MTLLDSIAWADLELYQRFIKKRLVLGKHIFISLY